MRKKKIAPLKITSCSVYPVEVIGNTKAIATVVLNEQLQLTGLKLIDGVNGYFVAYPRDNSKCIYYPLTKELGEDIQQSIIDKYLGGCV